MPNQPAFGKLHKIHPVHETEQERSERALHRVEDENREFNEESRKIAADISILQLGINEKTARTSAQGVIGPNGENPTLTKLREEKVQSALYRAVQGNETYETEFGEDSKNYLGSANVVHLEKNLARRTVAQFERIPHGVASMVGGNNFVEAEVDRRFGANRNVEARMLFVGARMRPVLENYATVQPLRLQRLYAHVGMALNPANLRGQIGDFIDIVENFNLTKLRDLREWCRTSNEPFGEDNAFRDLMLLVSVDQDATTEAGLEAVYDHQRLRKEWNDMREAKGDFLKITDLITDLLETNSLFPLENNVDGKAMLAELRVRMARNNAEDVLAELKSIADKERENGEVKITPFVLLQRWMRRDYCKSERLNPELFNEEANHYANLKAGLRVEAVESIDRKRSANDQAAEFYNRGVLKRGWNKLRRAVAYGQDFVGLEPINVQSQTADRIIEQVINSKPQEYSVFKGIDKFTTTRDLRDILNKTGSKVSPEVLTRFAETLEEAISRYKHIDPSLEKGLAAEHWDLENTISVLKKLRVEMWSRQQLAELHVSGAPDREKALVSMLKGARKIDEDISKAIRSEVKNPNAMWRKFLVKDALKAMLNEKELGAWKEIRGKGVKTKEAEVEKKKKELGDLPQNDPRKQKLSNEIANLESDIKVIDAQIKEAGDLYTKVTDARDYIKEKKLSRKQKKQYLKEVGLTQVFDKMSTNFRMQRAWHYTKVGAGATWSGTKKAWNWSRSRFLNLESAKKTFSVARLLATPVTWPLGKAWKWGTFPARLTYRALRRTTHMPKRIAGIVSKNMMRSYLRDRIEELDEKIASIAAKQAKLAGKIPHAPYSWDKKRLMRRINHLEEEKMDLIEASAEYKKMAADRKISLGSFAIYNEAPVNDNAKADKKINKAA